MKIILIGFMGSGKSTTAKIVGELLQLPVMEMDDLVYQKTNTRTMDEVFVKGGEPLLRQTEITIAQELSSTNNIVISTGGGVGENKTVLHHLKGSLAKVILLNAPFDIITDRLKNDTQRPLFRDIHKAKALYEFRLPLYRAHADTIIETASKSPHDIAQEVVRFLS